MELIAIRQRLEREKGRHAQVTNDLATVRDELDHHRHKALVIEQAQAHIQVVANRTQERLQVKIGDLVTRTLEAVFDDPYSLMLKFVPRRGKTEVDLWLERRGFRYDPMDSIGGGVSWVVALAVRVALWLIGSPRSRNVMVLDEPFHFIHNRGLQHRCSLLLKALSREYDLQMIMVTGLDESPELVAQADKKFHFALEDMGLNDLVTVNF